MRLQPYCSRLRVLEALAYIEAGRIPRVSLTCMGPVQLLCTVCERSIFVSFAGESSFISILSLCPAPKGLQPSIYDFLIYYFRRSPFSSPGVLWDCPHLLLVLRLLKFYMHNANPYHVLSFPGSASSIMFDCLRVVAST